MNWCKKMIASAIPVVDKVEHVFRNHIPDVTNGLFPTVLRKVKISTTFFYSEKVTMVERWSFTSSWYFYIIILWDHGVDLVLTPGKWGSKVLAPSLLLDSIGIGWEFCTCTSMLGSILWTHRTLSDCFPNIKLLPPPTLYPLCIFWASGYLFLHLIMKFWNISRIVFPSASCLTSSLFSWPSPMLEAERAGYLHLKPTVKGNGAIFSSNKANSLSFLTKGSVELEFSMGLREIRSSGRLEGQGLPQTPWGTESCSVAEAATPVSQAFVISPGCFLPLPIYCP